MKPEIVLGNWIKAPLFGSDRHTYFPFSSVALIDSIGEDSCSVTLTTPHAFAQDTTNSRVLGCSAEELVEILQELRAQSIAFGTIPRPLTDEERKEMEADKIREFEAMGEAVQRGAERARKQTDREDWGNPGM